jgi:hypothetical protein
LETRRIRTNGSGVVSRYAQCNWQVSRTLPCSRLLSTGAFCEQSWSLLPNWISLSGIKPWEIVVVIGLDNYGYVLRKFKVRASVTVCSHCVLGNTTNCNDAGRRRREISQPVYSHRGHFLQSDVSVDTSTAPSRHPPETDYAYAGGVPVLCPRPWCLGSQSSTRAAVNLRAAGTATCFSRHS